MDETHRDKIREAVWATIYDMAHNRDQNVVVLMSTEIVDALIDVLAMTLAIGYKPDPENLKSYCERLMEKVYARTMELQATENVSWPNVEFLDRSKSH